MSSPLSSSSREGVTHFEQVPRWTRTRSCSRSFNRAPNSSESGSPPPSSRAACWEGPKRNPPRAPDIILSYSVKGHWTQEGYEGPFGTHGQTVLRPKAYVDLQPLGLTWGEEKSDSPFVSTLRPPSRIGPNMQVFQQVSSSPDQAYLDPRCTYDQFRSSWRSGPNHIPRMQTGPSLQRKGPGRVSLPLQAPSRKPLLLVCPSMSSYYYIWQMD